MKCSASLIISLDFELHWGVRNLYSLYSLDGSYSAHLQGEREAVPAMLKLFEHYELAATWASVGMLYAANRAERQHHNPSVRPAYYQQSLDPYTQGIESNENQGPLQYAYTLLHHIRETLLQELASHTYGHVYALEPGMTPGAFEADLRAAVSIAEAQGDTLRSL